MKLKWDNYQKIAKELNQKYPDYNLFDLTKEKIKNLVNNLDDFSDEKEPKNEDVYLAIETLWNELKHKENNDDDSIYDALA